MRVITGFARGRKLQAPPGLDTRPTAEMTKEAVFSIIQFEIEGARVLDLFAGSGQMGIEALSRGAKFCVFVDNQKACLGIQRENLMSTQLQGHAKTMCTDVFSYLRECRDEFDIVFADPPYNSGMLEKLLPMLSGVMSESGAILIESDKTEQMPEWAGEFALKKEYRYGKAKISLYRKEQVI